MVFLLPLRRLRPASRLPSIAIAAQEEALRHRHPIHVIHSSIRPNVPWKFGLLLAGCLSVLLVVVCVNQTPHTGTFPPPLFYHFFVTKFCTWSPSPSRQPLSWLLLDSLTGPFVCLWPSRESRPPGGFFWLGLEGRREREGGEERYRALASSNLSSW